MEDKLISFKTAELANKVGFNIRCDNEYTMVSQINGFKVIKTNIMTLGSNHFFAPTQSLLAKWLREIHGIHILVIPTVTAAWTFKTVTVLSKRDNDIITGIKSVSDLPPYKGVHGYDYALFEDALEEALKESLTLI